MKSLYEISVSLSTYDITKATGGHFEFFTFLPISQELIAILKTEKGGFTSNFDLYSGRSR